MIRRPLKLMIVGIDCSTINIRQSSICSHQFYFSKIDKNGEEKQRSTKNRNGENEK